MRTTEPQRTAAASLRGLAGPYRVVHDAEGWPMIPGRLGQIEYHDGRSLAVFTDRRRMHFRLLAVPGVQRYQTGDDELRALFSPTLTTTIAGLIKARRRRTLSSDQARRISGFPRAEVDLSVE